MSHSAKTQFKSASVEAVVIRADGSRENLGVISYWSANPFKRLAWKIKNWMRGRKAGTVTRSN